MGVERTGNVTTLTGVHIKKYGLLVLRSRLKLEIDTGMTSRFNSLHACKRMGFEGRTRKQALKWLNEFIKTFNEIEPDGTDKPMDKNRLN